MFDAVHGVRPVGWAWPSAVCPLSCSRLSSTLPSRAGGAAAAQQHEVAHVTQQLQQMELYSFGPAPLPPPPPGIGLPPGMPMPGMPGFPPAAPAQQRQQQQAPPPLASLHELRALMDGSVSEEAARIAEVERTAAEAAAAQQAARKEKREAKKALQKVSGGCIWGEGDGQSEDGFGLREVVRGEAGWLNGWLTCSSAEQCSASGPSTLRTIHAAHLPTLACRRSRRPSVRSGSGESGAVTCRTADLHARRTCSGCRHVAAVKSSNARPVVLPELTNLTACCRNRCAGCGRSVGGPGAGHGPAAAAEAGAAAGRAQPHWRPHMRQQQWR